MVTQQQVLDTLKQIGLNLYERKLWIALLSRGVSSAGELSGLAKVPHSRTYDILQTLTDKGFVLTQNTKPLKYVAIKPSEAFERVKKRMKENLDVTVQRIDDIQSSPIADELENIFKNSVALVQPAELTASLKGRKAMHNQLENLFKNAKKSISIMTTVSGLDELHQTHGNLLKKAAGRGVKIRIAVPVMKDSAAKTEFSKIASVKHLSKKTDAGRFFIVDGNHAVLSLTHEKTHPDQDVSIWTQSEHLAATLLAPMFEDIWNKM